MVIYLDIILLHNILINMAIIYFNTYFCKIKVKWFLTFIAAAVGSIIALIALLFLSIGLQNIVKFILPAIMYIICSSDVTSKIYFKLLTMHIFFTLIFSGITLCIKYTSPTSGVESISIFVTLCSLVAFAVFCKTIVNYSINLIKKINNYTLVEIIHNGIRLLLVGFNDTGNELTSRSNNLPVLICNSESIKSILSNSVIEFEIINFQTISQAGYIKTFKPDLIHIDGKRCNAVIGISPIKINTDYDILLNFDNIKYNETETNYVKKNN